MTESSPPTPVGDGSLAKGFVMLASFIIGAVMIAAAYHKILEPAEFAKNIYNYQAAPDSLVNLVAVYLPWLELLVGACLIFVPRYRLASAWLSLLLLIFFTVLIAITVMRGINITCGCFSADPEASKVGWTKVAENCGLIALALVSVVGLTRQRSRG